jgi:hypothetical protein
MSAGETVDVTVTITLKVDAADWDLDRDTGTEATAISASVKEYIGLLVEDHYLVDDGVWSELSWS